MSLAKDSAGTIASILSKSWEELEALEFDGRLLFPAHVLRRKAKDWERIDVVLRVPREPDMRRARLKARAWAAEEGLDPELDPAMFENMDSMCVLTEAIRNPAPPHEPWEPFAKELESKILPYNIPVQKKSKIENLISLYPARLPH